MRFFAYFRLALHDVIPLLTMTYRKNEWFKKDVEVE